MDQTLGLTDKEIVEDILSAQKQMTGSYNIYANECATQAVRDALMNLLNEEHLIQTDVFTQMQNRNWYTPKTASLEEIKEVSRQFGTNTDEQMD